MVVGSIAAKSRPAALSSTVAVATSSPMISRIRTAGEDGDGHPRVGSVTDGRVHRGPGNRWLRR
jgi:hypothetical protein